MVTAMSASRMSPTLPITNGAEMNVSSRGHGPAIYRKLSARRSAAWKLLLSSISNSLAANQGAVHSSFGKSCSSKDVGAVGSGEVPYRLQRPRLTAAMRVPTAAAARPRPAGARRASRRPPCCSTDNRPYRTSAELNVCVRAGVQGGDRRAMKRFQELRVPHQRKLSRANRPNAADS